MAIIVSKPSAKERVCFIDFLRIIACFLVIVNHTNSQIFQNCTPSLTWFFSLSYFFLSKTAVPIFLMISGYNLLSTQDTYKKTVRRFLAYGCSLVFFSGVYYFADYLSGSINDLSLKDYILLIINEPITNSFWYLYLYLGVVLVTPFLQRMVCLFTQADYHVLFLCSGLLFSVWPILTHYIPELKISVYVSIPLFHTHIVLFLLGQYFRMYCKPSHKWRIPCTVGCIFTCLLNVYLTYYEYIRNYPSYFLFFDNIVLFPIVAGAFCLFGLISTFEFHGFVKKNIFSLSKLTFGIYMISDLMIYKLVFIYQAMIRNGLHAIPAMLIYELAVFVICAVVVWLLKKVPVLRRII